MKAKRVSTHEGKPYGIRFDCPGCKEAHVLPVQPYSGGWEFNDSEERPTVSPSILVHAITTKEGREVTPRCHSFVRAGRIQFLSDCGHELAGQTVDLPDLAE